MKYRTITGKIIAVAVAVVLALSVTTAAYAATVTSSQSGGAYSSTTGGENAVLVNGKTVTLTNPTVTKSGNSTGDDADFYGTNAAVLAENGATLTITGATVTTDGAHANAVFSYGSGTTVNISDSRITTTGNNSGGIMTTGGGTTNAEDLTVTTSGDSSAAIRSDRGGGDVNVTGGTYSTGGVGSPAIYSTADIDVEDAALASAVSEAVVVEGKNSVSLTNCTVTGDNTRTNGQATNLQNVMIYQSMSGDASQGTAAFTMNGGSMTAKSGDMFYVTNTSCTIDLTGVNFTYADGDLLTVAAGPWGSSGSNGGSVTLTASAQTLKGTITVDSVSTLNLILKSASAYTGAVNSAGAAGKVYVEVPSGCTWTLTADSYVTSLTCVAGSIDLNGHTLYVNGTAYTASASSAGSTVSGSTASGSQSQNSRQPSQGSQQPQQGGNGQNGQQPPQDSKDQDGRTFRDVPDGSWYGSALDYCYNKGLVSGTGTGRFSPDKYLSRAEMTQMLYTASGEAGAERDSGFTDVPDNAWYAGAVAWASAKDVVSGLGNYIFDPSGSISRQDLVCMLYRYYTGSGMTGLDETADISAYPDASSVASYAEAAMEWAVGIGIISGVNGKLDPTGTATRAQAVQILYKFLSAAA
jgi:hypothetical protein